MESSVKVGVRIRPLTNNERSLGGKDIVMSSPHNRTIELLNRKFTYDAVYDSNVSQSELYERIGGEGMLESFLDGYNQTILAYGQTGSGKTFTMGSEAEFSIDSNIKNRDINNFQISNQGLIPRFMDDIFRSMLERKIQIISTQDEEDKENQTEGRIQHPRNELVDFKATASFLEVYGEDIRDLLSDKSHEPLPIREDGSGVVVISGLTEKTISSANDAMNVLLTGTMNRTTAATLMNQHSSRSHAIFTINLTQTLRQKRMDNLNSDDEDLDLSMTSKFTFVDLAGSERMKKTGAEGERAKEGIEINKGLLALGNVINALADEERLMKGGKVHVPYRQAKLTRLLQDALGGNSQTLFLACVSPSDTNASETISTLSYANRARNIKNAPTKNLDATAAEIQRLTTLSSILQRELIRTKFPCSSNFEDSDGNDDKYHEELLQREDVKAFLTKLYDKAEKTHQKTTFRSENNPRNHNNGQFLSINQRNNCSSTQPQSSKNEMFHRVDFECNEYNDSLIMDINPDEDMALLDKLLELQHLDNQFNDEAEKDHAQLVQVEGELKDQESLLLQLKESLKVYHTMKERYEILMVEVQSLENEKVNLAKELERVQNDPTKGCSISIKKKLDVVEKNLHRARSETKSHQQMYRKAEQEALKCKALEKKIEVLKHDRVGLLKKQKESALKHRESVDAKSKEIISLKKKEMQAGRQMSKLENEVEKHKLNLEKRKNYCDKLSQKLKETESHLMKVLAMRKRDLRSFTSSKRDRNDVQNDSKEECNKVNPGFFLNNEEVKSLKFLLEKFVSDKVSILIKNTQYEERVAEYGKLMKELMAEMKLLQRKRQAMTESSNNKDEERDVWYHTQNIQELEFKIEVVENELNQLQCHIPEDGAETQIPKQENDIMEMIANQNENVVKTLLWDLLSTLTKSEKSNIHLNEMMKRKEAAINSFETEVYRLNQKIDSLLRDLDNRKTTTQIEGSGDIEGSDHLLKLKVEKLEQDLIDYQNKYDEMKEAVVKAKDAVMNKETDLAAMTEKITVLEVIQKNSDIKVSDFVMKSLDELQSIWNDIGVPFSEREIFRLQITNCLDDTIQRLNTGAQELKSKLISDTKLLTDSIREMYTSLGKDEEVDGEVNLNPKLNLSERKKLLERSKLKILPTYLSAIEREKKIAEATIKLMNSLNFLRSKLSVNLMILLRNCESRKRVNHHDNILLNPGNISGKQERAKKLEDVKRMMQALEASNIENDLSLSLESELLKDDENVSTLISNQLSESFLDKCEEELKKLKMLKSEVLVLNNTNMDQARDLAKKMHIRGRELLTLIIHSIKKRKKNLPNWWDIRMAEDICRSIVSSDSAVILVSDSYTRHLDVIFEAIDNVSSTRRTLSSVMLDVITDAHKTLISTVESEIDECAFGGFNEALTSLPLLSKEYNQTCIDEIKILITAVDAMSQSEVEALTVVWEALSVESSQRGNFWSEVEDSMKRQQTLMHCPFDSVWMSLKGDVEEWVRSFLDDAMKIHRVLHVKLFKLKMIHSEVERLRSKQDIKSRIISLDSEIRIISSKLTEFENNAGNRERLVTKKSNSSKLLTEERFRKQMQANFSSKLNTIGKLLIEWERAEGVDFDASILSDDVRCCLTNSCKYDDWVKKRTQLMHLKTVNKDSTRKSLANHKKTKTPIAKQSRRRAQTVDESSVGSTKNSTQNPQSNNISSYSRRSTLLATQNIIKTKDMKIDKPSKSPDRRMGERKIIYNSTNKNESQVISTSSASDRTKGGKTLLPFGNVL